MKIKVNVNFSKADEVFNVEVLSDFNDPERTATFVKNLVENIKNKTKETVEETEDGLQEIRYFLTNNWRNKDRTKKILDWDFARDFISAGFPHLVDKFEDYLQTGSDTFSVKTCTNLIIFKKV